MPPVPAPVIHAPADNGIVVTVDDFAKGDDHLAIAEALAEVKRKRAGRLVFANRIHRIKNPKAAEGSGQIVLDGLTDLTIEGNGCTLLFHAIKTGVFVKDCNRVLVRNLNIDWDRLLSSAGVVEEKDGKKYVRIAPEYDVAGLPLKDLFEFDVEKRHWLGSFAVQTIPAATQVEKGLYLLPNTYLLAGTRVGVRHAIYDAYGCFVTGDSNDVAFENIEVRQTPGIGFMVAMAGRGFRFRDVRLALTTRRQLLTTMADVVHLNSTKGDILIERCDFSYNGDDGVAISTLVTRVKRIEGDRVWLKYPLADEYGVVPPLYGKGDTLGFLDEGTRRLLGRAVVEDVVQDGMALVVRLRKEGEFELPLESLCGNFARRAERVAIRDNRFHDHRARGVCLNAKDVCIENNLFSTSPSMAILVTAAEGVAIRNNRFENVGYARDPQDGRPRGHEYRGEISVVGTYDDVTVEGNTWIDMNDDHERVWFEQQWK